MAEARRKAAGLLRWTSGSAASEIASIDFHSDLGEESGYVRLRWTSEDLWSGETRQCENRITR